MSTDDNEQAEQTDEGVSRRTFLQTTGVAVSGTSDTNLVAGVET